MKPKEIKKLQLSDEAPRQEMNGENDLRPSTEGMVQYCLNNYLKLGGRTSA